MTLELNICTNVVAPKPAAPRAVPSKQPTPNRSGFDFSFGKKQQVKAVVARRRVIPAAKKEAYEKKEPTIAPKFAAAAPLVRKKAIPTAKKAEYAKNASTTSAPRKNFVARPPSDNEDDFLTQKRELIKNIDSGLSLNISTSVNPEALKVRQTQKLTRDERLKKKRMERHNRGQKTARVLTDKEIDEGIKKFSENPKPRKANGVNPFGPPPKKVEGPPKKKPLKKENLFMGKTPDAEIVGQRLVKPLVEKVFTGDSIASLDLHPHCVKNLADVLNITELTTVQQKAVPRALEGRDILVRSQTGSGKTLAYALPVVQKLQEIRPKLSRDGGISAVVIVPTRELALQTYEFLIKLLKPFTWIVPGFLTGGEKRKAEKARLRKGINILVGTPGRLVDHLLHTESFKLDKAKFLVLDEADRLLEMGYERDVKMIVEAIDEQRTKAAIEGEEPENLQRLLLSATLTPAVQKLAGLTLKDPLFIDNSDEDPKDALKEGDEYDAAVQVALDEGKLVIPENLQLSYIVVPPKLRLVSLSGLLAKEFGKKKMKALVFMSTVEMVNFHHDLMNEQLTQKVLDDEDEPNEDEDDGDQPLLAGVRFFKLHGSMTQTERSGVFKAFKDSKCGVLLTTDVTGRGIDFPELDLVVQYSPPQKIADFVHRVGRTARAGRSGRAVLFLNATETQFVRKLEDKRIRISQGIMDDYLQTLVAADSEAHNVQEATSNLQHRFEELIEEDNEMKEKARKAYVSWLKFYSTFPKDLKPIFNIKVAHMGHYAKSFGLREQPTSFAAKHAAPKPQLPSNRLTYTERDPEKIKLEKKSKKRGFGTTVDREGNRLHKFLPKSTSLSMSEFDSGLPALKKKKKN